MIKRQYVIIALSIILFMSFISMIAYAAVDYKRLAALYPQSAVATGSGINIVGKVISNYAAGTSVTKLMTLAIPGTGAAKIAAVVLGVAGALAADYVFDKAKDYFDAERITRDENGNLEKTTTVTHPEGMPADDFTADSTSTKGYGISADQAAALALCQAELAIRGGYPATNGVCGCTSQAQFNHQISACGLMLGSGKWLLWYYPNANTPPMQNDDVKNPLPSADFESKLASDILNGNLNAIRAATASLEAAANALANANTELAKNQAAMTTINTTLVNSLTSAQNTTLANEATTPADGALDATDALTPDQITAAVVSALTTKGLSDEKIAAANAAALAAAGSTGLTLAQLQAALASAGLSASEIGAAVAAASSSLTEAKVKDAVKTAIDDETGVVIPVDPEISLPEKLSLTSIMNDFWTSVQALPIFNVLNGITIQTSGSSNLCIDLPSAYGGSRCFNGANVQDELNMIGTAILGLTTVISFIGVFKG